MEHLCDQYVGVEARTIRMISLDICFTCGNKHKAKCRHATSLPCRICKKRHLTALCPLMDVENNENELNQAKTNPI
uniref:Uncharacterized protein n=1 Tax=Caenorhabditis japonica TaxID=281687 RepID=A0A8R1EPF9_CAEJA